MKKRIISLLLSAALVFSLAACGAASASQPGGGEESASAPPQDEVTSQSSAPVQPEGDDSGAASQSAEPFSAQAVYPEEPNSPEEAWKIWEDNPVDDDFSAALKEFARKTAAQVLKEEGGCYSPLSLYYALALAAQGAEGETAEELCALLGADKEQLNVQCGNLFRRLYGESEEGTVLLANSLWMDNEVQGQPVTFREDYLKGAMENYYASVFTADFSDSTTLKRIGDWVEENTRGLLRFEPEGNESQILSIINTLYFKSGWTDAFEKSATREDTFTAADGTEQKVPFMHRTDTGDYVKGKNYSYATLDLNKGAMHFYLPDEGVDVRTLLEDETILTAPYGTQGGFYEVEWSVPKFTQDSTWKPMEALRALGVNTPFTTGADFSAMTDTPACITSIQQGTHIGVDEDGVEAAAYTAIGLETTGVMEEPERVEMNLNRPFLYTLTSDEGEILFVGICESVE